MSSQPHSSRIAGLASFAVAELRGLRRVHRRARPRRSAGASHPCARPDPGADRNRRLQMGGRTSTLALFIAAGRRAPAFYAALAVAAAAAGAALGLGLRPPSPADPIWFGAMVGVGLGAAALGPLVRRFGGASLSDVIATRFPNPLLRIASGLVVAAAAALIGLAGYRTAVAIAEALITTAAPGPKRSWARRCSRPSPREALRASSGARPPPARASASSP